MNGAINATIVPGTRDDGANKAPLDLLRQSISLANEGRAGEALAALTVDFVQAPHHRNLVRQLAIAPAMREGRLDVAAAFLERLVEANPQSSEDRLTLGSVLIRAGRRVEGQRHIERAGEIDPDNLAVAELRLQGLIQAGEVKKAAALARLYHDRCAGRARLAQICLMALARDGDVTNAQMIADSLKATPDLPPEVSLAIAQTLGLSGRHAEALAVCREAITRGGTSPRLHLVAAQAILALGAPDSDAVNHLEKARAEAPKDLLVLRMLGETLLRLRRYDEAAQVLTQAADLAPELKNIRMLRARALKFACRYDAAANAMLEAVRDNPGSQAWRRYATTALLQAGRTDEAAAMYDSLIRERRNRLTGSFTEAVAGLYDDVSGVPIPQARFDFAWALANRLASETAWRDRTVWERRARWGCLVDLLILDWLECLPQRVGEIADLLDIAPPSVAPIRSAVAAGKGVLLAGAHIGPMYAGPLALRVGGVANKWLASTPRVSSAPYADSLISTSDQTEEQVARQVLDALRGGYAVVIAIDGAMCPSAPRVAWEGQQVTYSDFCAYLSYRLGTPSFFTAPYWSQGRIGVAVRPMPTPEPREAFNIFAARWMKAFFGGIAAQILRGPENLRLSGGIWRGIR